MLSLASTVAAAQHRDDASPAWAQDIYKHSTAPGAAAYASYEGNTKSTLGHPALSKYCVPQLEGGSHLRVCLLLRMRAQPAAAQKLHFIFASLKQRKKGLGLGFF